MFIMGATHCKVVFATATATEGALIAIIILPPTLFLLKLRGLLLLILRNYNNANNSTHRNYVVVFFVGVWISFFFRVPSRDPTFATAHPPIIALRHSFFVHLSFFYIDSPPTFFLFATVLIFISSFVALLFLFANPPPAQDSRPLRIAMHTIEDAEIQCRRYRNRNATLARELKCPTTLFVQGRVGV